MEPLFKAIGRKCAERRANDIDKDIIPADMDIVKEIRDSIVETIGPNLSPDNHMPSEDPLLGSIALFDDIMESEPARESKRVRVA